MPTATVFQIRSSIGSLERCGFWRWSALTSTPQPNEWTTRLSTTSSFAIGIRRPPLPVALSPDGGDRTTLAPAPLGELRLEVASKASNLSFAFDSVRSGNRFKLRVRVNLAPRVVNAVEPLEGIR